jgi:hypothetical protein
MYWVTLAWPVATSHLSMKLLCKDFTAMKGPPPGQVHDFEGCDKQAEVGSMHSKISAAPSYKEKFGLNPVYPRKHSNRKQEGRRRKN